MIGEEFVAVSSLEEIPQMVLFGTPGNFRILSDADYWHIDGTFKCVPNLSYQLLTIHAKFQDKVIPLIYALLPDRTAGTYGHFLDALKAKADDLGVFLSPVSVMTDFESGLKKALKLSFPLVELEGCFFHYCQCIMRAVQKHGLSSHYKKNEFFRTWVHQVCALSLLPATDVQDAWVMLYEERQMWDSVEHVCDYVTKNWVDKSIGTIKEWNSFGKKSRTNNIVEAWHRRVNSMICQDHPNIYLFIQYLQNEQLNSEIKIEKLLAGTLRAAPRKQGTIQNEVTMRTLESEYVAGDRSVLNFLTAATRVVSLLE